MAFDDVQFPVDIVGFGSRGGPGHQTMITETDSGHEERVGRWEYPRHRLSLSLLGRSNAEIAELRAFAIARQGALRGFRAKDHNDFTTSTDGVSAPTDADVEIGTGDGLETQFQLIKLYTSGMSTITRKILKPITGTIVMAIDGTPATLGVEYTIDDMGLVTFGVAVADTLTITYGCYFDVPVRFDESVDEWLATSRTDVDENTVDRLEMVELFDPAPINIDRPYLGAYESQLNANLTLSLLLAHTYILDFQSAGLFVQLPTPTGLPTGGELWSVINGGATTFTVKDHLGATLATLTANTGVDIHLSDDGVGGHVWYAF